MAYNFTKLPKRLKTKWVKALRSGEYKQATGALYDPDQEGYCCFGVLGKLIGKSDEEMAHQGNLDHLGDVEGIPSQFIPNVEEECPLVDKLVLFNDGKYNDKTEKTEGGKSFKYIANWIEKYL